MTEFFKAILDRLAKEPVLIVTALAITFTAASESLSGGASPQTALLIAGQALIGWLLREAVVPMRKVSSGEFVIDEPEAPLPLPDFDDSSN